MRKKIQKNQINKNQKRKIAFVSFFHSFYFQFGMVLINTLHHQSIHLSMKKKKIKTDDHG